MKLALGFDDVVLIPQYSEIRSRFLPSTSVTLRSRFNSDLNLDLDVPILSANMDTISGENMCKAMWDAGGIGCLHRNWTEGENVIAYENIVQSDRDCFVTLGVNDWQSRSSALYGAGARYFILDIAHGHSVMMKETIIGMRKKYQDSIMIVAGNVATEQAVHDLTSWGTDIVKVGIGSGAACSTRVVTGHGYPMFSTLLNCQNRSCQIISDGGIKNSGDITKSFVAGADMVMIGSLLSGTDETPGEIFNGKKVYRGMASHEAQGNKKAAAEGVSAFVPLKGPVSEVVRQLNLGLKSGMSYCNSMTLEEIPLKAKWEQQTWAAHYEGIPHILTK